MYSGSSKVIANSQASELISLNAQENPLFSAPAGSSEPEAKLILILFESLSNCETLALCAFSSSVSSVVADSNALEDRLSVLVLSSASSVFYSS